MNRRRLLIALAVSVVIAGLSFVLRTPPAVEAVPEDPFTREAEQHLTRYIAIDTSNPPGNETTAARFLASLFEREGLKPQMVGRDPARQSLYVRIRSGTSEPALLLLHHIDVVPAVPAEWSVPPFDGVKSGGYVWGRGALDVKSLGIAQLMAVLDLVRSGARLKRDVIFLAAADEEAGGLHGMKQILEDHPDLFENVGWVLNEGGAAETVVDRVSYWGIEIDQKVPLWVEIVTSDSPGHASSPPLDGGSAAAMVRALSRISAIDHEFRLVPPVETFLRDLGSSKPGRKGVMIGNASRYLDDPDFTRVVPSSIISLLRDTVTITQLSGGTGVNSTPSVVRATLDARLLPGSDTAPMLERIRRAAGEGVEVNVLLAGEATDPSPTDTELFMLLRDVMRETEPQAVIGPLVSSGTSDSRFFRARGIPAYGIAPFKVNYYDATGVHGIDEKIRSTFFAEGVQLTRTIVRRFCVAQ